MRRGCLIIAIVIPLVLVVGGAVALYQLNRQYGVFEAAVISHETLAGADTRVRATVRVKDLSEFIVEAMPPGAELPSWVPLSADAALPQLLPHEAAIIGGADYRQERYAFTIFVNERRGGPFIAQMLNQSPSLKQVQGVELDPEGVQFRERGVLTLSGSLPMPERMEEYVLEHWTHDPPPAPLVVEGGHLFEVALDNRNGDLLTLWGAILQMNGQDLEAYLQNDQTRKIVDLLPDIFTLRLQGDLINPDALRIALRVDSTLTTGPNLQAMLGFFVIPQLQIMLRNDYGVKMEGDAKWDVEQGALVGEFTLTDWREKLLEAIRSGGATAQPTPKVTP